MNDNDNLNQNSWFYKILWYKTLENVKKSICNAPARRVFFLLQYILFQSKLYYVCAIFNFLVVVIN